MVQKKELDTYDNLDRLNSLTSPAGIWNYAYVGNTGKLDEVTNPNQTRVEYSYDGLDRLTQVENRKSAGQNNELISRYAYALNNRDLRTSVEKKVGGQDTQTTNYSYDDTDQLTGEQASEATALPNVPYVSNSFAYDAMGNRSTFGSATLTGTSFSTSTVVNRLNQITSQTLTTLVNGTPSSTRTDAFNYDLNGNLQTQSNNVNSANTSYTYDEADRLTQVVNKDDAGVNQHKSEYRYDGFSRKVVSKEFSWDVSTNAWVKDDEVRRIYDGMDVIQERDDTNAVKVNYTRSGNIGGLLSKTDSSSGSTFFYHYDGSGNVTQMSDVNQASVAEYSYDAYGNTLRAVGTQASGNRYRYSTKEWQSYTGLYDYGYRFYAPNLGRWINRDPIREEGGLNLYGFVGNSSINYADSYGLFKLPSFLTPSSIIAAVGAAASLALKLCQLYACQEDCRLCCMIAGVIGAGSIGATYGYELATLCLPASGIGPIGAGCAAWLGLIFVITLGVFISDVQDCLAGCKTKPTKPCCTASGTAGGAVGGKSD